MSKRDVRTVLVIEDNSLNRAILCDILTPAYRVLEADNGQAGLDILQNNGSRISLILLDIQMPVMNGYDFLKHIGEQKLYRNIPIIVATASNTVMDEIRCLDEGASDFVTKPYNPDIVLKRVESLIRLSEASSMLDRVEYDRLTGLYSKEFFFERVERLLQNDPETPYDMICADIDSFKVINNRFGVKKGNDMLTFIAENLQQIAPPDSILGRIGGDKFALLLAHREYSAHENSLSVFRERLSRSPIPSAIVRFGLYSNVNRSLPIAGMCDNAQLALAGIKRTYGVFLAEYNDALHQRILREQAILDSMEQALTERQFQVYYQPKHALSDDAAVGAEALIRWIHPEFGFLSPGEFIPLFERNGFISKLDRYVLYQVCKDLQGWIAGGIPVVPVSVNLSRANFGLLELDQTIAHIVDSFGVSRGLIHLEITESVYTDNPEQILSTVASLRAMGFPIELDDFGSGYSSLNILSALSFDVLKLDMSLVRTMHLERQKCVLSHILAMAQALQMRTVAEGVEQREQADALRSMGCSHAQGYFYAAPMPKEKFEKYLLENTRKPILSESGN